MQKSSLYLHYRQSNIKTLGPGNRYVIWTQGCPHSCFNCIAPESHSINKNGYFISVEELCNEILKSAVINNLAGLTISGGEPFLQAEALSNLIINLKKVSKTLDFIVFTGYEYSELQNKNNKHINNLLENIDILIDGKYIDELNENNYLRGSSNQNIIHLSDKYRENLLEMMNLKNRNIEVFVVDENRIFIGGIPPVDYSKKRIEEKVFGGKL